MKIIIMALVIYLVTVYYRAKYKPIIKEQIFIGKNNILSQEFKVEHTNSENSSQECLIITIKTIYRKGEIVIDKFLGFHKFWYWYNKDSPLYFMPIKYPKLRTMLYVQWLAWFIKQYKANTERLVEGDENKKPAKIVGGRFPGTGYVVARELLRW